MSSNQHHINPVLTRDNYEEAFLLYVDGELTPDQKEAVENFVLLHPDLKEELETLCSTILPADSLSFQNKDALLAASMKLDAVEESLLLYIDNELPAWEAKIVEAQLAQNKDFAQQHELLLKTKLHPEAITYPQKKELYRHTEKRIAPYWLRIAAAVVLVATGAAIWLNQSTIENTAPVIAVVPPKSTEQEPKVSQNLMPDTEINTAPAVDEKKAKTKSVEQVEKNIAAKKSTEKQPTRQTFSNPHIPEKSESIAAVGIGKNSSVNNVHANSDEKKSADAFNNLPVTSEPSLPYNITEAPEKTTVPVFAAASENDTKKGSGSMKGFLRKATRIIERRTGIKAVNDDNELLVGAVALKL